MWMKIDYTEQTTWVNLTHVTKLMHQPNKGTLTFHEAGGNIVTVNYDGVSILTDRHFASQYSHEQITRSMKALCVK